MIVNRSFLIDGMLERLVLDHDEIEDLWTDLGGWLQTTDGPPARYLELAPRFEKILRTHIEREDTDFFPVIIELLTPEQPRELGKGMAQLRSREFSAIGSKRE
jgi:hemerythrin-like domain-containing protein